MLPSTSTSGHRASPGLRPWYGHDPPGWPEFRRRYREELAIQTDLLTKLQAHAEARPLPLLFAARHPERNSPVMVTERLDEGAGRNGKTGA